MNTWENYASSSFCLEEFRALIAKNIRNFNELKEDSEKLLAALKESKKKIPTRSY